MFVRGTANDTVHYIVTVNTSSFKTRLLSAVTYSPDNDKRTSQQDG